MSSRTGRSLPISPFRRLVTDLMHFSAQVPSVTIDRRMKLAALVAARRTCQPRPSWTAIFTKAFAAIAARTPELRTSYMRFPWARLYEHPVNIVTMNFERLANGEKTVLQLQIRTPESRSLEELDAIIGRTKEEPVENIKSYRRARKLSLTPWPFRHMIWWGGLNMFGRRRAHNFGTFGVTSVGAQGAGVLHLIPLLTSTIHYGLFDETGHIDMRMSFDHRVLDGATAARALIEMEETLLTTLLKEIEQSRASTGREQAA
jgi:hypothetical protein